MSNRTAKFASAIFAGFLAGVTLTTISGSAARAADDCLSGPKDQTPQGGHWYYRVDRVTKRHCWYLGEEREKFSRVAPQNSAAPAKPVSPRKETAAQRSFADARAELPLPQTQTDQETSVTSGRTPATAANATSVDSRGADAWVANTQRSVVASRWPERPDVNSSASPGPTTDNSDATAPSNSAQTPSPTVTPVAFTAADSSSEKQSGSIRMLLIAMIGALSVAGLTGRAIFRFGGLRLAGRRKIRGDRRSIWDSTDIDLPVSTAYPRADVSIRSVDIPRELRGADDPNGRIVEMLARLNRSTAN